MVPRRPEVRTILNHSESRLNLNPYIEIYPSVPERLDAIAVWLSGNLSRVGLKMSIIEERRQGSSDVHGLTRAEQKLARHLCGGATMRQYAEIHGLSRNTVRNQLQSIFQKTGTHRQSDLVRALICSSDDREMD
jgi:DNA-binding CsgD family transcriptional regulator